MKLTVTDEQLDTIFEYREHYIKRLRSALVEFSILNGNHIEAAIAVYRQKLKVEQEGSSIAYLAGNTLSFDVPSLLLTDSIKLSIAVRPHKQVIRFAPELTLILSENPSFNINVSRCAIDRSKLESFLEKIADNNKYDLTCDGLSYMFHMFKDRYLAKIKYGKLEIEASYYDPNKQWFDWVKKEKHHTSLVRDMIERAVL